MGKARTSKSKKKVTQKVAKRTRVKTTSKQSAQSPGRALRALVIDDNPDHREDLKARFKQHGFRVFLAHSVDSAMRATSRQAYDVIVVDVRMPERRGAIVDNDAGLTVSKLLRSFGHKQRDAVVVAFTAYPNVRDCMAAVDAGAYYLPKTLPEISVAKELVEECVRRVVERSEISQDETPAEGEEMWRAKYHDELEKRFGGMMIAVVGLRTANNLRLPGGTIVGECKVFTAKSPDSLRTMVLTDSRFRKAQPVLFMI